MQPNVPNGSESSDPRIGTLTLPDVKPVSYSRNFVSTAVCEMRFPTLLEIETKTPAEAQKALRKRYPLYDRRRQATAITQGKVESEVQHRFASRAQDWVVVFRPSAIALETTKYTTFEDFHGRLTEVIGVFSKVIDSDFFTRVGIRYVNSLPVGNGPLEGWIRRDIAPPLVDGIYGTVARFQQEVRGRVSGGGSYTFRHGYPEETDDEKAEYVLDFDFWDENINVPDVMARVEELHAGAFQFFAWAAGPKTIDAMGKSNPKSQSAK